MNKNSAKYLQNWSYVSWVVISWINHELKELLQQNQMQLH
jgi:hypothetical protein